MESSNYGYFAKKLVDVNIPIQILTEYMPIMNEQLSFKESTRNRLEPACTQ